jgi:hypothetical protein
MTPELAVAGSLVFAPDVAGWWDFRVGASWRQPLGPAR